MFESGCWWKTIHEWFVDRWVHTKIVQFCENKQNVWPVEVSYLQQEKYLFISVLDQKSSYFKGETQHIRMHFRTRGKMTRYWSWEKGNFSLMKRWKVQKGIYIVSLKYRKFPGKLQSKFEIKGERWFKIHQIEFDMHENRRSRASQGCFPTKFWFK